MANDIPTYEEKAAEAVENYNARSATVDFVTSFLPDLMSEEDNFVSDEYTAEEYRELKAKYEKMRRRCKKLKKRLRKLKKQRKRAMAALERQDWQINGNPSTPEERKARLKKIKNRVKGKKRVKLWQRLKF